jgi:hypothetical protein
METVYSLFIRGFNCSRFCREQEGRYVLGLDLQTGADSHLFTACHFADELVLQRGRQSKGYLCLLYRIGLLKLKKT